MRTPSTIALAALLLAGATGCVDYRQSVEPYGICSMPDNCAFSGGCDAYALGAVGYDPTAGTNWLEFGVELRNQLPNNKDLGVGRVNNNDAHVTSMRLEFEGPATGTIKLDVGHQAVPANGTAVVWSYVFPPAGVVTLPLGTYTVNVIYIGYYDNGREFESGPFPIAVEASASGGYACPGTDVIACPTPGALASQQNLFSCMAPP